MEITRESLKGGDVYETWYISFLFPSVSSTKRFLLQLMLPILGKIKSKLSHYFDADYVKIQYSDNLKLKLKLHSGVVDILA